jgi:hypothetical protein
LGPPTFAAISGDGMRAARLNGVIPLLTPPTLATPATDGIRDASDVIVIYASQMHYRECHEKTAARTDGCRSAPPK